MTVDLSRSQNPVRKRAPLKKPIPPEGFSCCSKPQCKVVFKSDFLVRSNGLKIPYKCCPKHRTQQKKNEEWGKDVAVPVGFCRCAAKNRNAQCKEVFPIEYRDVRGEQVPLRTCPKHRSRTSKPRDRKQDLKHKAAQQRHSKSDKGKASKIKYNNKPEVKIKRSADHQAKMEDPALKLAFIVCNKARKMFKTSKTSRVFLEQVGYGADELLSKFERDVANTSGMTMDQHGFGKDCWNIGHRIAKSMYDPSIPGNLKRCWNLRNLFPQWQTENFHLKVKLPSSVELLAMKDWWPIEWNGVMPSPRMRLELEKAALKIA